MSQKTLDSFFIQRKQRPVDQHAAKKRKLLLEEDRGRHAGQKAEEAEGALPDSSGSDIKDPRTIRSESKEGETAAVAGGGDRSSLSVTSALDDHVLPSSVVPVAGTTLECSPDARLRTVAENSRNRKKRDSFGQEKFHGPVMRRPEEPERFTLGSSSTAAAKPAARRKLDVAEPSKATANSAKQVATFVKAGNLSPVKPSSASNSENGTVGNLGPLTPVKTGQKMVEEAADKLGKLTPEQIKARLGKVNRLADLKAQLRNLSKDHNFHLTGEKRPVAGLQTRRALFNEVEPKEEDLLKPKLSKEPLTFDVKTPVKCPLKTAEASGVRASPKKAELPAFARYSDLRQPDQYLPLPKKYRDLVEVFRNLDQVVGMKHNRQEAVRVSDVKPAVQHIMRRNFKDEWLTQIRCVFPKAYHYFWQELRNRLTLKPTGDFELHMAPNLQYGGNEGKEPPAPVLNWSSLTPLMKVERLKVFQHVLLEMVKDTHQHFLEELGIQLNPDDLTKWHRDFDVDLKCPDIDTVDLPAKPNVEKMTNNPKDMIAKLAGVNERLESALLAAENIKKDTQDDCQARIKPPLSLGAPSAAEEQPKLAKELRGLPPDLIEAILAKERQKRIRDMTQNREDRKELELLKELLTVAPCIINCHRSQRKGAAVPIDDLTKAAADSHGSKTTQEMRKLVDLFLKLVPECMEIKRYDKVDFVKLKKNSPDINAIRAKVEKLVEQEERKIV